MMNSLYFNSCCCLRGPLSNSADPCPEHGPTHTSKGEHPTSAEIYKALKEESKLNRSDMWAKSPVFEEGYLDKMRKRIRQAIKDKETENENSAIWTGLERMNNPKETFLFMAYFKLTLGESCNIRGKYFVPYKNKMRFAVPTNQVEIHVPNLGRNPDSIISEVLDNFELDQIDSLTISYSKIG